MELRLLSDEMIVEEFWQRDSSALEHTSQKYGKYITAICCNLLQNPDDSEECANDTILKAWNTIPPNRPENLKAYLSVLARGAAIDKYRSDHRQKRSAALVSLDDLEELLTDEKSSGAPLETAEFTTLLNRFLESLPKRERVCFVKRYYFGYTVPEIVKQTGISKSTLNEILHKLKDKLKEELTKEGYLL